MLLKPVREKAEVVVEPMDRRLIVISAPSCGPADPRPAAAGIGLTYQHPAVAELLHRHAGSHRPGHVRRLVVADPQEACRYVSSAAEQGRPFVTALVDSAAMPPESAMRVLADLWLADSRLTVVLVCGLQCPAPCSCQVVPPDPRLLLVHGTTSLSLADQVMQSWTEQALQRRRLLGKLRRVRHRNRQLRNVVTRQRRDAERLRHSALHDTLTSLPNRALMMDRLSRCIARAARDPDYFFALLFLDIDEFKYVNDSLGHEVGDAVLLEVSRRLSTSLRRLDTVCRKEDGLLAGLSARLGGDEFVVVLDNIASVADATRVATRLQSHLTAPIVLPGRELTITASMGLTIGRGQDLTAAALLREADSAMYRAKLSGRGRAMMFDNAMHAAATERQKLESALRLALERDELEVVYQPIISLRSYKVEGFEALLRWHRPQYGTVAPNEFIPLAEDCGLILPIQRWVLETVLDQLQEWNRHLPASERIWGSVNISSRQLEQTGFAAQVLAQMHLRSIDPGLLTLELKQSCLRRCGTTAIDPLKRLRDQGVQVCIDDFGSIPSALADLRQLPVDLLKIDRGVATTMESSRDWGAVVQAMTTLAHALHKRVVVEGIETGHQMQQVDQMASDYAQGYFFAHPLAAGAASRFIQSPPRWRLSA